MLNRQPMKRTDMRRAAAAPAKKELNREQRLAMRAQRAIKNAPDCEIVQNDNKRRSALMVPASVATQFVAPMPKEQQHRNRRLLDLAQGMPCLLRVPGVCNRDPATTVACHSNWREHGGKGGARKADDHYSVFGCAACHHWLDVLTTATKAIKQMAFMRAHADQVLLWRQIATDPRRAPADRRAAQWALDLLKATPNIDLAQDSSAFVAIN